MSWKPEEDIDFINKRIKEQRLYLVNLHVRAANRDITEERLQEIKPSAVNQLEYFTKLKQQYEDKFTNKNITSNSMGLPSS